MRIAIILGIFLLVIVVLLSNFTRLVGGISKHKATSNLEAYLYKKYKDEVKYKWLERFFNSGNMDPNMFSVLIYNTKNPEIEFYCHLNLKNILEDDTLSMTGLEKKTVNDHYLEAIKRYDTKQAIIRIFKTEISSIVFNHSSINLTFDANLQSDQLQMLLDKFVNRLNYFYEDLGLYSDITLIIKTPDNPEGFIEIPLEVYNSKWTLTAYLLSNNATNFKVIEKRITRDMINYLEQSHPDFEIYDSRKIFIDKTSLSRAASIQYLSDKNIKNDRTKKWQNPLKGVYVTYFDLETSHIYKGELLSKTNDKTTYDEALNQIKKAIQAEGVLAW